MAAVRTMDIWSVIHVSLKSRLSSSKVEDAVADPAPNEADKVLMEAFDIKPARWGSIGDRVSS